MPELKSEEGGDMFLLPIFINDSPPPSPPQSKLNPEFLHFFRDVFKNFN